MSVSDPALLALAESVADGSAIDWNAAESALQGPDQSIVRQLRIVAQLATVHRTLPLAPHPIAPTPSRRTASAPAIGRWAHLDLIERLGGGSFGEVYRAWDRQLEREVALKLLGISDVNPSELGSSRIVIEGRLLARVHHPNVVTVYGVAVHEGRVGLWMELIDGATLEHVLLKTGQMSAREAAIIGIDLCRALASLHRAGLIHRDIKTQNVMRESGGRIVLMDFGTGRPIDRDQTHALADLAGTPLYLAPELFDGAVASERTDLYSLGVLLYRLVTGAFPVRAAAVEALHKAHAAGHVTRLRDLRPDLPSTFVRVIDRAIAPDPGERYGSAGELEADLSGSIHGEPIAPPASARHPMKRWPAIAVIAAIVVAVGVLALGWRPFRGTRAPVIAAVAIRSIAVLPLVNLSGDPAQDYFADGMTDELITTLGQLGGVKVISRTSAMQFKGSKQPLPNIARALNVDAILEGSVLLSGPKAAYATSPRVRINARLIQAGTDTQVWDRTFEAVVEDLFKLQSQIAKAVADGVHSRLTHPRSADTQDFATYDLYLRGRHYLNMRTKDGFDRALQYFQEAIERSPQYAPAYAGIADTYTLLGIYGLTPRADAIARGSSAAMKALALDDSLAEAYASLGLTQDERLERDPAERSFQRAIALNPGLVSAHHWYAVSLARWGRLDDATTEIQQALTLDPLSASVNAEAGDILILARRYDAAIDQFTATTRLDPDFARAHMGLSDAYAATRVYDRALAEAEEALRLGGDIIEFQAYVGRIYAKTNRRPEALAIVDGLIDAFAKGTGGAVNVAVVYAALGDTDAALKWLNLGRESRDPWYAFIAVDPVFDDLRADARFNQLVATLDQTR